MLFLSPNRVFLTRRSLHIFTQALCTLNGPKCCTTALHVEYLQFQLRNPEHGHCLKQGEEWGCYSKEHKEKRTDWSVVI